MWYVGIVVRNGRRLFLISPKYGHYMLSDHAKNAYLFDSVDSARDAVKPFAVANDGRSSVPSDTVLIGRTYFTGDRLVGVITEDGKYVHE